MTVKEAITKADLDRRNDIGETEKIGYLLELDQKIKEAVLRHYPNAEAEIREQEKLERVLLVQEPYTDLYLYWLQAKAALVDGDFSQYNAYNTLFQQEYRNFFRSFHAAHKRRHSGSFHF